MKDVIILIFMIATYFVSAYMHEKDMIRHCVEDGTLYTWNNEYTFECKATKNQVGNKE